MGTGDTKEKGTLTVPTSVPNWRGWRGSNPRPSASEADTLSTELQPHCLHTEPLDSISRDSAAGTLA